MTDVFLGLGSNVGDREGHLAFALDRIEAEARLTGASSVYETDPVGFTDQAPFLNMAVRLATDRSPAELLAWSRGMETERGRVRAHRNAPRTLDIDVLLYGDQEVRLPDLTVPHPRMRDRAFVLVPLLELAPDLAEPGTGTPYRELLDRAGGGAGVRLVGPADALRRKDA